MSCAVCGMDRETLDAEATLYNIADPICCDSATD